MNEIKLIDGFVSQFQVTADIIVDYDLLFQDGGDLNLNGLVGRFLLFEVGGRTRCVDCSAEGVELEWGGRCKACFDEKPWNQECILKPELCNFEKCLTPEYRDASCTDPHVVYLAWTGEVKVGMTRARNYESRWAGQGASYAVAITHTPDRYSAGLVERFLAKHFHDRTNWKAMVYTDPSSYTKELLSQEAVRAIGLLPDEYRKYAVSFIDVFTMRHPVDLSKPVSQGWIEPEPSRTFEGEVRGLRGGYLILPTGAIKMDKLCGRDVRVSVVE